MAVRIRLRRMGRKGQPHYRIVVADGASPRDGNVVETLGYYQPLSRPARLVVNLERLDYWTGQGALLSDTVSSLVKKARKNGDRSVAIGAPEPPSRRATATTSPPRGPVASRGDEEEIPADAAEPRGESPHTPSDA